MWLNEAQMLPHRKEKQNKTGRANSNVHSRTQTKHEGRKVYDYQSSYGGPHSLIYLNT